MLHQTITKRFLKSLEHLAYGSFTVSTPDGKHYRFEGGEKGANGTMHIRDWRTVSAMAERGDIGLTESYRDGWWDTEDLTALLLVGLQNEEVLNRYIYGSAFTRAVTRFFYFFKRNNLKGSQRNIHAHYDLGNDFYALWLDPSMTYSSALFGDGVQNLTDAQHQKYDRIIERLNQTSGSLIEVGCGWGGFAERAMEKGDYAIKGITLSKAQHAYATKRLEDKANIVIEDYRHQQGKYDHLVSIEMFEAVGERYWPVYFGKIKELLASKGRAVIQTITVADKHFESYRKGGDMIRSFIFPGGMLPSPERFASEARQVDLRVTDTHAFGQDYARTLKHWLDNFENKLSEVIQLGFDEQFIRIWRFYLAACIASFTVGRTDVMQLELQHA
ncbi:MAG: class I SAM-dependent methyltransferase [Rickettsiales bacterium]